MAAVYADVHDSDLETGDITIQIHATAVLATASTEQNGG